MALSRWTGARRRYELLDQIGAGAHGTVWSAWDRDRQRGVVAKLAPERSSPEIEHRFLQERRLRVEHPHVISATDDLEHRGRLGFVMEFADVGDLAAVVGRHGPFDTDQVTLLTRELLAGLDHLHRRGILHRDIKPTNVLFRTVDGEVTAAIGDLGTALDLDGPRLTTFAERIGTVGFMAPEVEAGAEASERSDLFSLGRTLEFALTGSTRTAPLAEDVPEPLRHVLGLLVATEPELRARNATEALALLPEPPPSTRFPGAGDSGGIERPGRPSPAGDDESGRVGAGIGRVARRFAPLAAVAIASSALTFALVRGGSGADDPSPTTPTAPAAAEPITGSLALGERFTCILGAGGATRCRGPLSATSPGNEATNTAQASAPPARSIWAGPLAEGPCLVADDAALAGCLTATPPTDGLSAVSVGEVSVDAAGGCVVTVGSEPGRLRCWGDATTVADALGDRRVGAVALAGDRGCALVDAGELWCWAPGAPPAAGPALAGPVTDVATGPRGTCAVADGRVWCWGDGSSGLWPTEPRAVEGLPGRVDRVAVGSDHGCALTDGRVACWGAVTEPTDPAAARAPLTARPVPGFDATSVDLAAGNRHTCARTSRDDVWCWGANDSGQIDPANPVRWLGPTRLGTD